MNVKEEAPKPVAKSNKDNEDEGDEDEGGGLAGKRGGIYSTSLCVHSSSIFGC